MNVFLKVLFNAAIGVVLIFIWLHFVNFSEIWQVISKVNLFALVPAFACMFFSPFLRALRLKVFLSPVKKTELKDLTFLNGISQMLNFFIPIRAGEVVKGVYLNNRYKFDLAKSVIWIFLDRFIDFLMVLLISAVLLLTIKTNIPANMVITVSLAFMVALFLTYFAIYKVDFTRKLINFSKQFLIFKILKTNFERFSHFILESFAILRREKKELALLGFITVLAYGADAGIWYFTFIALGYPQDFIKMYLGQMLSALTYLVPAAPGYVGSAEASGLLILSGVFGIDNNLASAMIVLFHILSAVFVIVFGLISVFSLKIDVGVLLKKALNKEMR